MEWHESDPLMLDGWHEFNRIKWGVRPLRLRFGADDGAGARLDAVLYLDRRGRVFQPEENPYIPVAFHPDLTNPACRVEGQWLRLAEQLAVEMRRLGTANSIDLPVDVVDGRPWLWAGFHVEVKYTYVIDLPFHPERMEKAARSIARKALRAGYRCERTDRLADAHACLTATGSRKGFRLSVSLRDLQLLRDLLGDECLRVYICYSSSGEPAAANVVLYRPGGMAVGWVGGIASAHLSSGAAQLLRVACLTDLAAAGATAINLAGANIPGVALAKSQFGGRLTPYLSVDGCGLKSVAHWLMNWWHPTHAPGMAAPAGRRVGRALRQSAS